MFKDIKHLLQNGFIKKSIPKLLKFEMLTKKYIENNRDIIWTLFIEYGYLIIDPIYDENSTSSKIKN